MIINRSVLTGALSILLGVAGCSDWTYDAVVHDDREQSLLDKSARVAFDFADYERAADLYRESLQRAYLRDDAEAIASSAFNLSASLSRLGRFEEARLALKDAYAASAILSEEPPADVLLLDARLARKLGMVEESSRLAEAAAKAKGAENAALETSILILKAILACDANDAASAQSLLSKIPPRSGSPRDRAESDRVRGRIAMLKNEPGRAAEPFDLAAKQYRSMGHYAAMAEVLADAGEAYGRHGDPENAANRYLRAGRSAELQSLEQAPVWLERALEIAEAANLKDIADEARTRIEGHAAPPSDKTAGASR
jgi:tetratricopeptide (TPR) repeat protein